MLQDLIYPLALCLGWLIGANLTLNRKEAPTRKATKNVAATDGSESDKAISHLPGTRIISEGEDPSGVEIQEASLDQIAFFSTVHFFIPSIDLAKTLPNASVPPRFFDS